MSTFYDLHSLAKNGDLQRLRELLQARRPHQEIDVNAYDRGGNTPLMHAIQSPKANVEMVRTLLEHGANVHQESRESFKGHYTVVALALAGGDWQKVATLIENGADIHYKRSTGSDALLDAVHGRDVLNDPHLSHRIIGLSG